jgi:mannose-1-phosphate guanylyltransferase
LTRFITGDPCPKQFCSVGGARTLLAETLARIGSVIPPERTVVVGNRIHAGYFHRELPGPTPRVLLQPSNRGTGPGILLPVHWVSWRDPEALVAIFPCDHFVLQERAFLAHVAHAVRIVRRRPELVVLLGMEPDGPEDGYGWIESGEPVFEGAGCCRVQSFREKPTAQEAHAFFRSGFLWNSLIIVGRVGVLKALGREYVPGVDARLSRIQAFAGSEYEAWAIQQAYALMRPANFSRDVLEPGARSLTVLPVRGVLWSDWGTPERVIRTLDRVGTSTPWLQAWSKRSA